MRGYRRQADRETQHPDATAPPGGQGREPERARPGASQAVMDKGSVEIERYLLQYYISEKQY